MSSKTMFFSTATMLIALFFTGGAFADWGVTDTTFDTSFLYDAIPEAGVTGDASFVTPQYISDGWHERGITFIYSFEPPVYPQAPTTQVGDAGSVTAQFLSAGSFHQRNNSFFTEFTGSIIAQPATQIGDAGEVTLQYISDGWHERGLTFLTQWAAPVFPEEPVAQAGDAGGVAAQTLGTGWHNRNHSFSEEFTAIQAVSTGLTEPGTDYVYNVIWNVQGGCQSGVDRHFKIYFDDYDDGKMFWPTAYTPISTVFDEFFLISTHDYGDVTMFRSNADGTFSTEYVGRFGARGWSLAIADFSEDGLMDFVSGADVGSTTEIYFHRQKADSTFESKVQVGSIAGDWGAMDMATADFNNDNHIDFVVSGNNANLYIFKGDGTGSFTQESITHTIPVSYFRGKDAADVDNDGDVDFVMSANMSGSSLGAGNHYIWLFRNAGNANFSVEQIYVGAVSNTVDAYHLTLADFNEDGFIDVTMKAGHSNTNAPMKISFGDGTGTFLSFQNVQSNGADVPNYNYMPADNTDFNHDGHQDLVFTNYDGEHVYFMPGNGDGTFGAYADLGAVDRHGNNRALIMGIAASGQYGLTDYSIVIGDPVEFTGGFRVTLTECGQVPSLTGTVSVYQNGVLVAEVETDEEGVARVPVPQGTYNVKGCLTIDSVLKCNWRYGVEFF